MKNLFKILIISLLLPSTALADGCELIEKLKFGEKIEKQSKSLRIDERESKGDIFEVNVRAKSLCKLIPAVYINLTFTDEKLAKAKISGTSEEFDLYFFVQQQFGDSNNKPNFDEIKGTSFADLWEKDGYIITYSYLPNSNFIKEEIIITYTKLNDKILAREIEAEEALE